MWICAQNLNRMNNRTWINCVCKWKRMNIGVFDHDYNRQNETRQREFVYVFSRNLFVQMLRYKPSIGTAFRHCEFNVGNFPSWFSFLVFKAKRWKHSEQLNGSLRAWIVLCCNKWGFCVKSFEQISHWNDFFAVVTSEGSGEIIFLRWNIITGLIFMRFLFLRSLIPRCFLFFSFACCWNGVCKVAFVKKLVL